MILLFWMLRFKPDISLSFFAFIHRLSSSSWLSAIRVMSSEDLRLLIFLWAILIPACSQSRLAFCMMDSAYKLNKLGDNIQSWLTPCLICNQFVFHVQFELMLPDLHTDFSRGRSGGLVFSSLSEMSTVCCDIFYTLPWLVPNYFFLEICVLIHSFLVALGLVAVVGFLWLQWVDFSLWRLLLLWWLLLLSRGSRQPGFSSCGV